MPVHVLTEGAGPSVQVPPHLTRISVSVISTNKDYSNKKVKGKVVHIGPLVVLEEDNYILKTIIQEEDPPSSSSSQSSSINVVLFGSLAKDYSRTVNKDDVVLVSGFTVGKSPTVHKDKLHPCNLQLSGDDACIYVMSRPSPPPDPPSLRAVKRSATTAPAEVSRATKAPKPVYVSLGDLKAGHVVSVYGVVVFFKQPFKSRGTDLCTTLKITDQSNEKIGCTIFREKLEDHPKIFQVGDIICLNRVKIKSYNGSVTLINTFGFSAVTYDGAVGGAVEPRTSSRSFVMDQEDRRMVEELRSWASTQALLPPPTLPLSGAQPKAYFDLTCQLLAKAPIDTTCTLLRVWDGTRCSHSLLKVFVEPNVTEGPSSFPSEQEKLIANVLVYDNHVESASQLKPGDFVRIYNLRAIQGPARVPGLTSSQSEEVDHLAFHLHGGTAYGRGIRVLPETSPEVQELKRVMEAFPEENNLLPDSDMEEIWITPPESKDVEPVEIISERSCGHDLPPVSLSQVKQSDPGRVHHVRVRLRSYQPRRLHQALKLYCTKCSSLRDIPDEDLVSGVFSEALRDSGPCSPPSWVVSGEVDLPGDSSPRRSLSVHLPNFLASENKSKELIFLGGATLEETCRLSAGYNNIIPVRSSGGHMTLLDLSAPFLFRGRRRYYGCPSCSDVSLKEPSVAKDKSIAEKLVAEALGVQLLTFALTMKMELQDKTDTLEVFLWRDAELFFSVSAEDVSANQEAQDKLRQMLELICPPGGSTAQRPWLDLCLCSSRGEEGGQSKTLYQIRQSSISRPSSTCSDPA